MEKFKIAYNFNFEMMFRIKKINTYMKRYIYGGLVMFILIYCTLLFFAILTYFLTHFSIVIFLWHVAPCFLLFVFSIYLYYVYRNNLRGNTAAFLNKIKGCISFRCTLKDLDSVIFKREYYFYDTYFILCDQKRRIQQEYSKIRVLILSNDNIILSKHLYFEKDVIGEENFQYLSKFLGDKIGFNRVLNSKGPTELV